MQRRLHSFFMSKIRKSNQGFTLVELLVVMAIMLVLIGISVSAIPGIRSTYNRRSAVNRVMGAIELARVSALQSGENVYVIMALARDSGVSDDAIIVAGDPPFGSPTTGEVFYTHWIRLPPNIRFRSSTGTLAVSALPAPPWTTSMLPVTSGSPTYAAFTFNSTGTLSYPASGTGPNSGLDLALFEGIRNSHGVEKAQGASAKATLGLTDAGLYEVIRLNRYTGRSWLDISTLIQK